MSRISVKRFRLLLIACVLRMTVVGCGIRNIEDCTESSGWTGQCRWCRRDKSATWGSFKNPCSRRKIFYTNHTVTIKCPATIPCCPTRCYCYQRQLTTRPIHRNLLTMLYYLPNSPSGASLQEIVASQITNAPVILLFPIRRKLQWSLFVDQTKWDKFWLSLWKVL